ncbi:MAG: hypothetical protein PHU46_12215 [Rhodocyclaceae bacterium]|nr:hypothetical protein [Rhodocyclaceae bacterium]
MKTFDPKRPAEEVTLTFDFSAECASPRTVTAQVCSIEQVSGATDPDLATMLVGSAVAQGTLVLQRIAGGVLDADYLLVAQISRDDGEIRELPALLKVRRWT